MLVLLGLVAFALPTLWTTASAQGQIQIEYFRGTAYSLRTLAVLKWRMTEDTSLTTILVERSNDNAMYMTIGEVAPVFTGSHGSDYIYLDTDPDIGINYYRLRLVFHNGEQLSSPIKITLLPPPVFSFPIWKGSTIVGNPDMPWEKGQILDISGRAILGFEGNEVELNSLPSGMYVLRTLTENGWQASLFAK